MKTNRLLACAISLAAINAYAADVYVTTTGAGNGSGSDWANASANLGEVLYNATLGTNVHVGAGVYHPTVDYKGDASAANIEKRFKLSGGVSLLGGYPAAGGTERDAKANQTILDGAISDSETVYTIAYGLLGDDDIVVDGFVFRNGTGRQSGPDDDYMGDFSGGAGAIIVMAGNPIPGATTDAGKGMKIANCEFNGFSAKWGGAIKLQRPDQPNNPKLTMSNCSFTDNHSGQNGGAVLAYNWDMDVDNSYFENNTGGSGGALALFGSVVMNSDKNIFTNNTVTSNGGGILCYAEDGDNATELKVTNSDFIGNQGWDGVGVYSNNSSNCLIEGCTFDQNTGGGAGVIRLNGTYDIRGCVFSKNEITNHPGGWLDGSRASISNCIYTDNKSAAGANGAAFKVQIGDEINITDCYMSGNAGKSIIGIGWGSKGLMKNVSVIDNTGTAVAFQGCTYTCQNMTISGNTSPTNGGVFDGSWEGPASLSIYDCTIVNNTSADGQNAMYISGGTATIDFDNCIYTGNGDADVDYSTVFGSFARDYCIWDDVRYSGGRFFTLDAPFEIGKDLTEIIESKGQHVHALIGEDNPAVGNGSPNSANTLDQLGNMRPEYPSIGAVEYNSDLGGVTTTKADDKGLTVYPTVTTGQVIVRNPFTTNGNLLVYSTNGILVKKIVLGEGDNLLDFSDLTGGIYILSVQNSDMAVSARIVKR